MRVIYIDSLFLINLAVNYLLLLSTAKICAITDVKLRIAAGACIGAVYAVLSVYPNFQFLQSAFIKAAAGVLILCFVFGGKKGFLRISLVFLAVSAAFGGITMLVAQMGGEIWAGNGVYVPVSARSLILSFGTAYALLTFVFKFMAARRGTGGFVRLTVMRGNRKTSMLALLDTGSSLRDPVTSAPVPIVEHDSISTLFTKEENEIISRIKDCSAPDVLEMLWKYDRSARFRLMPYSAVGISHDLLLTFKADSVLAGSTKLKGTWVAVSPTGVSEGGAYCALICADIEFSGNAA